MREEAVTSLRRRRSRSHWTARPEPFDTRTQHLHLICLAAMRTRPVAAATSILIGAVISVVALAGCTASDPGTAAAPTGDLLADHGLEEMDAREVIEQLEATPVSERSTDLVASVRTDTLALSDKENREASLPLPAGEFYVSIAPFVDQTHDCFFHSLTTCLGELRNQEVAIEVIDNESDTVLVDKDVSTHDNGFAGLWLPRGIDATLTIEHEGRTGTIPISTGDDQPTCLTTLQLT